MSDKLDPIHPGEILRSDYLEPAGLSANALANALDVTPGRINDIVRGRRGISADTALRLSRYFGTTARFWLNLQDDFELEVAEDRAGNEIQQRVAPRDVA
ncbi:MAG: HigA family addiction module antidote protein [Spiribacter salinus]|uniref:HigA family addiction module antidote protein n=1 Tax=Spiribacter salinus TaxID=1335746 RepID=A0A540VPA0_9GAMM|nr:MAG: HigA family addiction module antidote protein [Spiribacter salinus]